MRFRSSRPADEAPKAPADDADVRTIDAALRFVAGQRWVRRQTAVAILETVREMARGVDAPEHPHALIDAVIEECDQDRVQAAMLVDKLLDIRNATSQAREPARAGARAAPGH